MTDTDLPPFGYPETAVPPHGHPAYELYAHLSNAITALPGEAWIPLDQREKVARRTLTVAVRYINDALMRAGWVALDDLAEPGEEASEDYRAGFHDAQEQVLEGIDALQQRLTGGIKPDVEMLVPEIPAPMP